MTLCARELASMDTGCEMTQDDIRKRIPGFIGLRPTLSGGAPAV